MEEFGFRNIPSRVIEELLNNGMVLMKYYSFREYQQNLIFLFGLGNVNYKDVFRNKNSITLVKVTKTGKEHCIKRLEIEKYLEEKNGDKNEIR